MLIVFCGRPLNVDARVPALCLDTRQQRRRRQGVARDEGQPGSCSTLNVDCTVALWVCTRLAPRLDLHGLVSVPISSTAFRSLAVAVVSRRR